MALVPEIQVAVEDASFDPGSLFPAASQARQGQHAVLFPPVSTEQHTDFRLQHRAIDKVDVACLFPCFPPKSDSAKKVDAK